MKKLDVVYVLAACAVVSACGGGGGGVASTPPAPPTVTPPPPPPLPPPPPTTANADLINLTASESFTNNAATGAASYPKAAGNFSASSGPLDLTVIYDQPTRTYSISATGRNQSFAPSTRDLASSTSRITVYKITSGTTTDTLTLTNPGTAGALTYRYVGAGYWQRTVDGASAISGNIDAFTYGVETPDAAVPRTGGATYAVDLLGIGARSFSLTSLSGTGQLQFNFFDGAITGSGSLDEVRLDMNAPAGNGIWRFNGTLAGASNGFTGTLGLYDNATNRIPATTVGRLFGPAADEVGASFYGSFGQERVVGTLTGRKSASIINGNNPSLLNLQFNETFASMSVQASYAFDPATGAIYNNNDLLLMPRQTQMAYRVSDQALSILGAGGAATLFTATAANRNAGKSNNRYSVHETQTGNEKRTLWLYQPGPGNNELALTYSSFGRYELTRPDSGQPNGQFRQSIFVPYGIRTADASVPRTGTANYAGIMRGEAILAFNPDPNTQLMGVEGTATFALNFGTSSFQSQLSPVLVNLVDGTRYDYGPFGISGNYTTSGIIGIEFAGSYAGTPVLGRSLDMNMRMMFMGPNADELAGYFGGKFVPPGSNAVSGTMQGVILAKKQ